MESGLNLSERIRQFRLQKGFSQENMADMLGLSTSAYGDLERARTELSFSRLENIAKVMEVPLAELLGFGSQTMSETEWLRQENTRLWEENGQLQAELDQWKDRFKLSFGENVLKQIGEQRDRIGFK